MHDQLLAERLMAGDERAFRDIFGEYGSRLERLARALSSDDAVVEDTLQETWFAIIRGIHAFTGRSPLRVWMFAILANQERRVAARRRRFASPDDADAGDDGSELRESGMSTGGAWREPPVPWVLEGPETSLLERDTLEALDAALATLPREQRVVVLLRDVEGVPANEVGVMLDMEHDAVLVRLQRGRSRMRQALDRYRRYGVVAGRPALRDACLRG